MAEPTEARAEPAGTDAYAETAGWAEKTGFAQMLGISVDDLSDQGAVLSLGYRAELSNGDGALHGGVAASMIVTASRTLARAVLGEVSAPWHSVAVQVAYLSAAIEEGLTGRACLLRKGKELAYVDVDVTTDSGKRVAKGLVTVRGRFGADPVATPVSGGDASHSDPGPMGPFIASIPFHAALGLAAEHMAGGQSRITMPAREATSDGAAHHEGALLALVDTTGAMAAWAETGPGRYKASTPVIQARIIDSQPAGDLIGYGRVVHHDRELLFCTVEICGAGDGRLIADGTVNYRIVTPDLAR